MASKRRNRPRRPARRSAFKAPKRRLLIVCEGEVTEPAYLRGFERWVRNTTVEIDIPAGHGVPLTLVQRAKALKQAAQRNARRAKDDFLRYDEVWCVFDIDEHPHLNDARQLAKANSIELAISNPCFELWLLLHFQTSPGDRHRHDIQKMLREFIPGYDKHLDFERVAPCVGNATKRARQLEEDANAEGEPGRAPTTGVFHLTDSA